MKKLLLLLSVWSVCSVGQLSAAERRTDLTLLGSLNNVHEDATLTIYGTLVIDAGATFDLPAGAVGWADVSKTGSSLADLATRSASDLSSGTLPDARFPATLPAGSGVNLMALNATQLTNGTVPDARFPATLPALSGVNLTALNASNLGSGTVPEARLPLSTVSAFGAVKPDGTTITISSGIISAAATTPGSAFSGALGTDDTYEGTRITGLTAGATIAQWELVYLGGSGTWLLADADGSGTIPARGIAVAAYSSTDPAIVVVVGTVRNDAWAWTPGGTIYLSTTAGGLTQTAPSTSDDNVQQVGYALTADIAFFNFASGEYLTVE